MTKTKSKTKSKAKPKPKTKTKRKTKAKTKTKATPRGVDLIETVIAKRVIATPMPLAPAVIAQLTLDGAALPPSLARWLAYDASWMEIDSKRPLLRLLTVAELAAERFGELAEAFEVYADVLPGRCLAVPLPTAEEQVAFLYIGRPDDRGEYPVFVIDTDDEPAIALASPGFDVHLARQFGVIEQRAYYGDLARVAPDLGDALAWHAEHNFGGNNLVAIGRLATS